MLAWTGWVSVDMGLRVYPLPEGLEGVSSATAHDAAVQQGGLQQILLFIGIAEMISWLSVSQMLQGSGRAPGDFGLDPLALLKNKSEDEVNRMKLRELKNGRLAMLAFSGACTQAVLSGHGFPYV
jgi:light-harvesting complex I chlorophyll a/b binding protein 1